LTSWTRIPSVSLPAAYRDHYEEIGTDLLGLIVRAAKEGEQRLIRLSIGAFPFLVINNPSTVGRVLTDPDRIFVRPKMDLWRRLLGEGVLTSDGEEWIRSRRRAAVLMGPRHVGRHARIVANLTDDQIGSWTRGEAVDILAESRLLTLFASLRSLCGVERGFDPLPFIRALINVMEYIQKRETSTPGDVASTSQQRRFESAVTYLRDSVDRILELHLDGTDNLVSYLLSHPDRRSGRLTDEELRNDVLAHLIAGYESTATAVAWTLLLLAREEASQIRLREEIRRTFDSAADITEFGQLPYAQQVVTEALRLYPPTWGVLRAATHPIELDGFHLPRGTCLMGSTYAIQRDARWFDRPDEFVPERWSNRRATKPHPFTYFPFGGGRHACPGRRMGQVTAAAIISRIVQRFRLRPAVGGDLRAAVNVTLQPTSGTMLQVI
jgi:cytochrome P450